MPAPTFDAQTSAATAGGTGITVNHTVGAGSDRLLVAGVFTRGNFGAVDTVTWDTTVTPTTLIAPTTTQANTTGFSYYVLETDLATGAADFIFTSTLSVRKVAFVFTFTGVDQTTPFVDQSGNDYVTNGANSTAPSSTVAGTTNDFALDFIGAENDDLTLTVDASQTAGTEVGSGGASGLQGNQSREAGATSVSMDWTLSSAEDWISIAAMLAGTGAVAADPIQQIARTIAFRNPLIKR